MKRKLLTEPLPLDLMPHHGWVTPKGIVDVFDSHALRALAIPEFRRQLEQECKKQWARHERDLGRATTAQEVARRKKEYARFADPDKIDNQSRVIRIAEEHGWVRFGCIDDEYAYLEMARHDEKRVQQVMDYWFPELDTIRVYDYDKDWKWEKHP